jgi:hypothetical protein
MHGQQNMDVYRLGAGLAVTEAIRDTGQNVLQLSTEPETVVAQSYCHVLLTVAFLEVFIRNTIIITLGIIQYKMYKRYNN